MTVTPIEEVRPDDRQTIQEKAKAAIAQIRTGENATKEGCVLLYRLFAEFGSVTGGVVEVGPNGRVAFHGFNDFYKWIKFHGYRGSQTTSFNHLNAGYAILKGLDPDGEKTLTELYDLGSAAKSSTPQELEAADTPEKAAKLSEAKRNAGLVRVFIPEVYAPEADVVAERIIKLGLAPSRPEAIGLALIAVSTLDETEFRTLLERQTGGE